MQNQHEGRLREPFYFPKSHEYMHTYKVHEFLPKTGHFLPDNDYPGWRSCWVSISDLLPVKCVSPQELDLYIELRNIHTPQCVTAVEFNL